MEPLTTPLWVMITIALGGVVIREVFNLWKWLRNRADNKEGFGLDIERDTNVKVTSTKEKMDDVHAVIVRTDTFGKPLVYVDHQIHDRMGHIEKDLSELKRLFEHHHAVESQLVWTKLGVDIKDR